MRKAASPVTSTHRARPMASSTLMVDRTRTPRSTPETAETVAMMTARAVSPIWVGKPCGSPNRMLRATFSWTTPTPSEAAMPKTPPTRAAASTMSPMTPSVCRPSSGRRVERSVRVSRRR